METVTATPTPVTTPVVAAKPPAPKPPTGTGLSPSTSLTGEALCLTLIVALVALGAGSMARKKFLVPGESGKFQTALACDTCLATWCSLIATLVWWNATLLPITKSTVVFFGSVFLAGAAIALVGFKLVAALTRLATS